MLLINIQLFADGGGDAGAAGGTAVSGVTATDAASQTGQINSAKAETGDASRNAGTDAKTRYADFRNGEFKSFVDEEISNAVQKRIGKLHGELDRYKAYDPLIDGLAKKYGADRNDPAAMLAAMDDDAAMYEAESLESGVPIETLKRIRQTERENEQLRQYKQEHEADAATNRILADWLQQSDEMKKVFPTFDFDEEMKNPQFKRLLTAGIDVRGAYQAIHSDDIIQAGMQFATQKSAEQVGASVQANRNRPTENGLSNNGAGVVNNGVSLMSRAERAELNRRAIYGESITL